MYKKILVTGGNGFLGKHVMEELSVSYPEAEVLTFSSSELDLRNREDAINYFKKVAPDAVISVAARLGGIGDNRNFPASYFYDNICIGINTIDASRMADVKKLVLIGTVCSYPEITPAPFKEEDLWNGYPEPTNGPYGIAKKAVGEYAQAVQKQYGLSSVHLLLTNLYGPGDDFRDTTSHVIPAFIKKIISAKEQNLPYIEAWGDGSPTRDFLYVKDAAKGIVLSLRHTDPAPVNIASGQDISIKELYLLLCELIGFKGEVIWDSTKPNGQPKRLLDITKARNYFGYAPDMSFHDGLKESIDWYLKNRDWIDALKSKFNDE